MSIQIRNLCKSFQDNQVLRNVNLDVREKEIVVLMGLSGSGKTTLLRCLCDLETADSGEILINDTYLLKEENGKRVYADKETKKALRKEVGMVFQSFYEDFQISVAKQIQIIENDNVLLTPHSFCF